MTDHLIVVGAVNTDLVISTPHLPAPGETVVGDGLQIFGGGKGANAAVAASRIGGQVYLAGAVGADDSGTRALSDLQNDGIDIQHVAILDDTPTGAALIVVDSAGENQIALGPGANGVVSPAIVNAAMTGALSASNTVLVSTEIPVEAVAAAIEAASRANVHCILNPAPVIAGLIDLFAFHPIVTPNEIELKELARHLGEASGQAANVEDLETCLHLIGERTEAPVIVTLGAAGCATRLPDGEIYRTPAPATKNVVDTTGAGDTFNGVFAVRLAAGDEILDAVKIAVTAASLSVKAVGAREGMPDANALAAACQR